MDEISETWSPRLFILQLVSQLSSSECDESLLGGNPGDNRCALVSDYKEIKSNKTMDEEG